MTPLTPPTADPAAAVARFAATAPADVAYAFVDSPVGTLVAARTERGLACLAYEDLGGGADPLLERLATEVSPRVLHAPARLDDVRRELDEYFAGSRTAFDLPLDFALMKPFARKILAVTARIPFGVTSTYGEVAAEAGSPGAGRASDTGPRCRGAPANSIHCRSITGQIVTNSRVAPRGTSSR